MLNGGIRSAIALLLCVGSALAAACAHNPVMPAPARRPAHDVKTTPVTATPVESKKVAFASRVGKELFERDRAAWLATDLLRSKIPPNKSRGWLTERRGAEWVVSWLGAMTTPVTSGDIEVIARVIYDPATDKARIEESAPTLLTPQQQAAYRARTLVEQALPKQQPLCGTYNLVVMPAQGFKQGRRGWLIYALVAMPSAGIYPVGGDHEFLVTENGERIIEARPLSRACLDLGGQKLPEGAKPVAFTVTDLISDAPLPQHVFVSLQSRMPVYVLTIQNQRTWLVTGDKIELVDQ
jgi:hypothetical protein